METLQRILEPYRHLDPLGWVGVYRELPAWAGVAVVALGVLMLLFGGQRLFRLVAGPLGAALATVWAAALASRFGFPEHANRVSLITAFALFGLGLLAPAVVVFFAFGIPAGLLTGQLAGPADWMLGFAPGLLVGGAVGVVLRRTVSAVLSATGGAWLVVLGAMAALAPVVPSVSWLGHSPVAVLAIAACLAVAGVVFQLFVRPSPEEAEKQRADRGQARRASKDAGLSQRWSRYGKKG